MTTSERVLGQAQVDGESRDEGRDSQGFVVLAARVTGIDGYVVLDVD